MANFKGSAECPDCGAEIPIPVDCLIGEIVACACCGLELEVKSINPLILTEVVIEGEDWGE